MTGLNTKSPSLSLLLTKLDTGSIGKQKVRVVVRVRPLLPTEIPFPPSKHHSQQLPVKCTTENEIVVANPRNSTEFLKYALDSCYNETTDQLEIFQKEMFPLLKFSLQGINTCVFAYGNTGAGKTFTMFGNDKKQGIIPRTVRQLFTFFSTNTNQNVRYSLKMSYFEIYNEKVYDLIKFTGNDLPIREDAHRQILIPGLTTVQLENFDDFTITFGEAMKNRTTASTSLNASSNDSSVQSKLHLIDLAGSEDNRKTENTGIRMVESGAINKSLFVLGKVVDALNCGDQRIPYRDSKLTRILQDSLGGKSKALMITNVAPCCKFLLDTYNTLNFASKSKQVCNNIISQQQQKLALEASNNKSTKNPLSRVNQANGQLTIDRSNDGKYQQTAILLSPMIKKRRIITEEVAKRCEALETKFLLKEGKIPINLDSPKKISPNSKSFLRQLMGEVKKFENNFDYASAIESISKALAITPWNEKMLKKRQSLQRTHDSIMSKMVKNENKESISIMNQNNSSHQLSTSSSLLGSKDSVMKENLENVFSTPPYQIISSLNMNLDNFENSENAKKKKRIEHEVLYIFNTGNKNDLKTIKGIGNKRAEQIAAYRIANGSFEKIEDLLNVEGFTQKIIDNILLLKYAETILS